MINEYVDSLEDNNPLKLEFLKVRNTLMKPDVMRKLFRMGIVNDRSSKISYFLNQMIFQSGNTRTWKYWIEWTERFVSIFMGGDLFLSFECWIKKRIISKL